MIDGLWCCWLILFFPYPRSFSYISRTVISEAERVITFWWKIMKTNVCLFYCRITCTDEECTNRPRAFIKKARINFDFTLCLIIHLLIYPSWLAAERLLELWEGEKTLLVLSFTQHTPAWPSSALLCWDAALFGCISTMLTKMRNSTVASPGLNVLLCQIYKFLSLGYKMTYIITNHRNKRNGPVLSTTSHICPLPFVCFSTPSTTVQWIMSLSSLRVLRLWRGTARLI